MENFFADSGLFRVFFCGIGVVDIDDQGHVAKTLGGDIKVVEFARFEKGEGIQKREDDFAAEVASMIK